MQTNIFKINIEIMSNNNIYISEWFCKNLRIKAKDPFFLFSTNDKYILSCTKEFKLFAILHGHSERIKCVCYLNERKYASTGMGDIRTWNFDSLKCEIIFMGHNNREITGLSFNKELNFLASCGGCICIWDTSICVENSYPIICRHPVRIIDIKYRIPMKVLWLGSGDLLSGLSDNSLLCQSLGVEEVDEWDVPLSSNIKCIRELPNEDIIILTACRIHLLHHDGGESMHPETAISRISIISKSLPYASPTLYTSMEINYKQREVIIGDTLGQISLIPFQLGGYPKFGDLGPSRQIVDKGEGQHN